MMLGAAQTELLAMALRDLAATSSLGPSEAAALRHAARTACRLAAGPAGAGPAASSQADASSLSRQYALACAVEKQVSSRLALYRPTPTSSPPANVGDLQAATLFPLFSRFNRGAGGTGHMAGNAPVPHC